MNAFHLMKLDHQEIKNLFAQLVNINENFLDKRINLFDQLKKNLDAHAFIEEQVFYPALKGHERSHQDALKAYEEHHIAKMLLEELEDMDKGSEEWMVKLKVLKENMEHHIQEEETQLFAEAEELLEQKELENLGEKMEEARKEFLLKQMASLA